MFPSLRIILQHKRHVKANHWDPSKLTHFNGYFDEASSSYPRLNTLLKCVALLGFQ